MTLNERLETFLPRTPEVAPTAYVSPYAYVSGAVTLAADSSVWPMAVLRGDINTIDIGEGSNVQDGAVVHLADDYGVKVGSYTTIGHQAMVHACTIGNECLIGMSCTILDGAEIGDQCIIGANSLVTGKRQIPAGSLVMGAPAKVIRELTDEERAGLRHWAEKYVIVARHHKALKQNPALPGSPWVGTDPTSNIC